MASVSLHCFLYNVSFPVFTFVQLLAFFFLFFDDFRVLYIFDHFRKSFISRNVITSDTGPCNYEYVDGKKRILAFPKCSCMILFHVFVFVLTAHHQSRQ